MKNIKYEKVTIKNALNLIDPEIEPAIEDLLFEIVNFLSMELRLDGVFNTKEVMLKTRNRIHTDLLDDLQELEDKGYIKKLKYTQYEVVKHLWE